MLLPPGRFFSVTANDYIRKSDLGPFDVEFASSTSGSPQSRASLAAGEPADEHRGVDETCGPTVWILKNVKIQ